MRSERRRIWNCLLVAVLVTVLAFVSDGCAADAYTVCSSGCDYTSIQAAIDAANSRDTIIVRDGIFTENIDVTVDNVTIRSENGSANCVVNALDQNDHVFEVIADYVNIRGFTVQNATGSVKAGIYLTNDHCTISENTASNNYEGFRLAYSSSNNSLTDNTASNNTYGISLYSNCNNNYLTGNAVSNNDDGIMLYYKCNNNNLTANTASNNTYYGITLSYSSNNNLTGNTANSNYRYGITLSYSSNNNTLTGNTANSNNHTGISLSSSSNNNLTGNTANSNYCYGISLSSSSNNLIGNTALNNDAGIQLYNSSNNNLTGNTATANNWYGIYLRFSSNNNTLINNTANSNNYSGMYLDDSSNNTLTGNTANLNIEYGIRLYNSSTNLIYNNYFDNPINADDDGNNIWNLSKIPGTNIIGGSWLGGNYWSDYMGEDTNGDGLGDTQLPYNSKGYIQNGGEWLPLVKAGAPPGRWDINEDCTVNFIDLAILSAHWLELPTAPFPRYDINEDGVVNFIDLAILSAHWLETTC
ncbi:MAG TPA: hypothetical protein ENN68_01665 [Methanomicrobia archaeon]|nr:hypothetical protein [Methanomicrobia archaeon]